MAADAPLSRLALAATSVADDLGYVALADLGRAMGTEIEGGYRVIGGHMVTALVGRWRLGADLYRETGDTDLGLPPVIVREHRVIERLTDLGYERISGNRFARTLDDIPVRIAGEDAALRQAVIDVLVPAYTSRPRQNHRVSDALVTTEVPGLATALRRPPVVLALELRRLNGDLLEVEIAFPDEVAALILKAFATRVRDKDTDIVDVWRCLEVAFAAGVSRRHFRDGEEAEAAHHIRELYGRRDGHGMHALASAQRLSAAGADRRFTRLQALIARVLGPM